MVDGGGFKGEVAMIQIVAVGEGVLALANFPGHLRKETFRMHAYPRSFLRLVAVLVSGAIAIAISAPLTAQTTGAKERYNAIAVSLNGGPATTASGRVLISIDRWSTPEERARLIAVFKEKGPDKLLEALQDNQIVGSFRLPNTLAWDLRYAYETPLPDGGRRVLLATDRRMGFQEQSRQSLSVDYPFTLIEIRFDKNGKGVGKYSVATKISLSKDKKTVELENYGHEPVRLTDVTIEK